MFAAQYLLKSVFPSLYFVFIIFELFALLEYIYYTIDLEFCEF